MTRIPHRLRRPRPERQADAGRVVARSSDRAGPRLPAAVVSGLRDDRSARRSSRRCTASATIRPTSCSCCTWRTAARSAPGSRRWIADGVVVICDRYIASSIAYGEAHGLDAAWLGRDSAVPAGAAPDHPPGHRARDRGRTQGDRARSLRARPGPAGPRPRELPPAGCGGRLGAPRRGARRRPRSPPTSFARSRHDSGCRHRADIRRARRAKHPRARLNRRPRRAHVVHEHDPQPFDSCPAPERKRVPHVAVPRRGRKVGLRWRRADAPQGLDHRHAELRRPARAPG